MEVGVAAVLRVVVEEPVADDLQGRRHQDRAVRAAEHRDVDLAPGDHLLDEGAGVEGECGVQGRAEVCRLTGPARRPGSSPAATGFTTTGPVQVRASAVARRDQPAGRRRDAESRPRPAWSPTCPSPARPRRPVTRRTAGSARSHSAARVPSSPCGPCTTGNATSQPRSTWAAPARLIGPAAAVPPGAVAADRQRHDVVRRGVQAGGHARGRGQRDLVLAAASAADDGDPGPHRRLRRRGAGAQVRGHARAEAGDDLVLQGAGPRRPLRDGRLARVAGAEHGDRSRRPRPRRCRGRRPPGPSRSGRRPAPVARGPAPRPPPTPPAAARRRTRAAPARGTCVAGVTWVWP